MVESVCKRNQTTTTIIRERNIMTKYNYLRSPVNRQPFAVVATSLVGNELHVGYAVCNPHDQFNKSKARQIAVGRMQKNAHVVTFGDNQRNAHTLRELTLRVLVQDFQVPQRLRKAATKLLSAKEMHEVVTG